MHTSMTRRRSAFRWLAAIGLVLAILPVLASDASAQYRRGGFRGRGYGYAPRYYSRGYGYAPRVYSRGYGYGYAPRVYNRGYGFYNYGVPFGNAYRSPFYAPGFRMGFGGYPY
jgi:hypothetical protein